jgi:hypothetical protein
LRLWVIYHLKLNTAIEKRFSNISRTMASKIKDCDGDEEKIAAEIQSSLWYIKHDILQILTTQTGKAVIEEPKPTTEAKSEPDPEPEPESEPEPQPEPEQTEPETKPEKVVKTPGIIHKIRELDFPLPYQANLVDPTACQGLKLNHSLYTQCTTKPRKNQTYCITCLKQIASNENKMPNAGSIQLRTDFENPMDFRDPKGKRPVHYMKVLTKLKISKEDIISKTAEVGIVLDECHFIIQDKPKPKSKNGRPKKKNTVVTEEEILADKVKDCVIEEKKVEDVTKDAVEDAKNAEDEKKDDDEDDEDDDEDCLDVVEIIYDGKNYLKDKDNDIIDVDTHEVIGKYNEITENIEFYQ